MRQLVAVAALVLVVALCLWLALAAGGEPAALPGAGPVAADVADAANAELVVGQGPPAVATNAGEQRLAVAAAGLGDLHVLAVWPDALPAAAVHLFVRQTSRGSAWSVVADARTDATGTARFAGLSPGKHDLLSDRGDRLSVEVAGGPQQVRFELQGGLPVFGTVRDPAGAPVPRATIWLQTERTDWTGGTAIALADAAGDYRIDKIPAGRSLGAFAPGTSPGPLVDLDDVDVSSPPVRIDLAVGPPGGDLAGTVSDDQGRPVALAIVAAGAQPRHLDTRGKRRIEQWTPRTARTDAAGSFRIDGLLPGELQIAVRAPGFGLWRATATIVAGQTTQVLPALQRGATLRGRITDDQDQPVAGARISAYDRAPGTSFVAGGQIDYYEVFGHQATSTDADGRYTLPGITPGPVHAFAQRLGKRQEGVSVAYVQDVLTVPPGADIEWSPQLVDGNTIAGVVLYRDGQPMPMVFLTLRDERTRGEHVMTNDAQGRFRFLCLPMSTFTLRVQYWDAPKGTPALEQSGLVPNAGAVELRAPFDKPQQEVPGTVVGRIDDAGHRIQNPAAVFVSLQSDGRWFREDGKVVDGAFRFERVTPCRFQLVLHEGQTVLAHGDWHDLAPAATVDTGVLRTEPGGSLRVRLVRDAAAAVREPKLYLQRNGEFRSTVVEPGRADEVLVPNLTPGDYEISGYGTGLCGAKGKATVRAGETAAASLSLRGGTLCRGDVWLPEGHAAQNYTYKVRGTDGAIFVERSFPIGDQPTRPLSIVLSLPLGTWLIEFSTDAGASGSVEIAVEDLSVEPKIRIDAK